MTLIITDDDVARHLPMEDCIRAMETAFADFAAGDAVNLPRARYQARHPDPARRYFCNVHVGAVPSVGLACVRAGSQIIVPPGPDNDRRLYENPRPFNWGFVILFDTETAEPVALMHEFALSGMRVGATSALAVDRMAPKDAEVLGLFGTGKQAGAAFDALMCVRDLRKITVYSPNRAHREEFVARKRAEIDTGSRPGANRTVEIAAAETPRQTVSGAGIVVCCTTAMNPVFEGRDLEDGQLVVSIANSDATNPHRSEVDETTYARSRALVVNSWRSVIEDDQKELLEPMERGVIDRDSIVELGAVVSGARAVTAGGTGIVYYKNNTGLAIQFAAAGRIVIDRVAAEGGAREIPTEWLGTDLSKLYEAGFRPSP